MAITIRTGANGSYKSAYTAYFVIYEALKAGRVVVTNLEGMQPLKVIEQRMDVTFPTTSKLIRVTSRDAAGVHLWTHFFCWCPVGALIVIDECQDIYSKNIGFDMKKVTHKPLEAFITKDSGNDGLLPESYVDFFYSRYVPADMAALKASETDDRGIAEYDSQGRIIYPHTFNEGFMRHRKYNWDIELLSPDWKQIDTGIKACAEQCFFHRQRDQFFWAKRKPFIWKHDKSIATTSIPKTRDVNLTTKKIPLDSFLLYKSTSTGLAKEAGAMNTLFRNPKVILVFLVLLACIGYGIHGISNKFTDLDEASSQPQETQSQTPPSTQPQTGDEADSKDTGVLPDGGNRGQTAVQNGVVLTDIADILPLEGITKAYVTGINTKVTSTSLIDYISIEANAIDGIYSLNENFLAAYNVTYEVIDECLLKLTRGEKHKLITCKPMRSLAPVAQTTAAEIQLF